MPSKVPASVSQRLDQLDHDLPPLKHYEPGGMFAGAQNAEGLSDDERRGASAEAFVFNLLPRNRDEPSVWGTYFGPMSRFSRIDGSEVQFPDITSLDRDTIEYWQERSKQTLHPVLRARYADAVWDLAELVTGARAPIEYAHIASDAYLQTIDTERQGDDLEAIFYAKRALQVALAINDRTRIDRAKSTLLQLLSNSTLDPKSIGVWASGFDALYYPGNKRLALTEPEKALMVATLEEILRRCSNPNGSDYNPWASQAAAQRLAKHYERCGQKDQLKDAIRTSGQAFESMASKADPLLAMGWLQPVIDEYSNRGMAEDAERAALLSQHKGKSAREFLKTTKVSTEVDPEKIDKFIEGLIEGNLDQALMRITAQFIPRVQEVRDLLQHMKEVAPFSSLIPVTLVEDGRFVAAAGSVEQDPDGRLIMQLAQNLGITAQFLTITLERARERHALGPEKIASFLFVSPVYDATRRATILEALEAYFSADLVKFVHLAVPQIEQALRTLLGLLGQPIFKPTRQGAMDVKNLNNLLREEAIKACLDESIHLYLLTFLADRRGVNLRNDLCHGLLPVDRISPLLANQVLHVLMTLALVREKKTPPASE
jgi:hypothetical protein